MNQLEPFDAAEALYWYCADYHTGQNSFLYRVLSQLQYKPSPLHNGPSTLESEEIYSRLENGDLSVLDLSEWIKHTTLKIKALRSIVNSIVECNHKWIEFEPSDKYPNITHYCSYCGVWKRKE